MAKSNGKVGKKTAIGTSNGSFAASIAKVVASAEALKLAIEALNLPGLTAEDRLHSDGRLRKDEPAAMTSIFDTMDAHPATFGSLADKDGGTNPAVLETAPARASLATATGLAPLGTLLDTMHITVSDAILATASQAKALSVPGYAIGKANAASSAPLRTSLKKAIDFYGASGRKRAAGNVRTDNRAKKTAKKAKPANA